VGPGWGKTGRREKKDFSTQGGKGVNLPVQRDSKGGQKNSCGQIAGKRGRRAESKNRACVHERTKLPPPEKGGEERGKKKSEFIPKDGKKEAVSTIVFPREGKDLWSNADPDRGR